MVPSIPWYTLVMEKIFIGMVANMFWSLAVASIVWFALKINGNVVNYYSVAMLITAAYMLAAPLIAAVKRE
jgi:hypothetical protein